MTTATQTPTRVWQIDAAHTQASFEVRHMMFATVRGSFGDVAGELHIGDRDEVATWMARATINAASINTGNEQRDEHLRSADFFHVEVHPELTFASTSVRYVGEGELVVVGDLTINGVTREVELNVEETGRGIDPWGNERIAFRARTAIDRRDFDLTWNQALETGGVLVGHEVKITVELQATQAA